MSRNQNLVSRERFGFPGWMKSIFAGIVLLMLANASAFAQSEEGIKSAFMYNFGKLTQWPATAFANDAAPINVGFVGADTLADLFEKNITGKNANGREFVVKKLSGAEGVASCQIVFVGNDAMVADVLGAAKGKPVLTVGESEAFVAGGGIIKFFRDGAKVAFDLDVGAAKFAELKFDEKLIKIAKNVKGG